MFMLAMFTTPCQHEEYFTRVSIQRACFMVVFCLVARKCYMRKELRDFISLAAASSLLYE